MPCAPIPTWKASKRRSGHWKKPSVRKARPRTSEQLLSGASVHHFHELMPDRAAVHQFHAHFDWRSRQFAGQLERSTFLGRLYRHVRYGGIVGEKVQIEGPVCDTDNFAGRMNLSSFRRDVNAAQIGGATYFEGDLAPDS